MTDVNRLILCFALSVGCILAGVLAGFIIRRFIYAKHGESLYKGKSMLSPFHILLVGFFVGVCCLFYPLYHQDWDANGSVVGQFFATLFYSLRNGAQVFIMEGDATAVKELIFSTLGEESVLGVWFYLYALLIFLVAPIFTATFVLSFFKNAKATLRYRLAPAKTVYYISNLTEKSIALAKNIAKEHGKGAMIVFFDVFEKEDDESNGELIEQANRIGAICFAKNITEIGLKRCRKKLVRKFYLIGENENENVKQALILMRICRADKRLDTKQNEFYVFATTESSEKLLDTAPNGKLKVRRINETKNLMLNVLSEGCLFENCVEENGKKKINLLIVGLGQYGVELLKAACWSCQMIGYYLTVHILDKSENCKDTIRAIAPELIEKSDCDDAGEAKYSLRFHPNIDVCDATLVDELERIGQITVAFTTLGDDELNMETAMKMSAVFKKQEIMQGWTPPSIYAVVYNVIKSNTILENGLRSIKGEPYPVKLIGGLSSRFSLKVIEQAEMEEEAIRCHTKWSETDTQKAADMEMFYKYEYYRNSSRAEAIYAKLREGLGIELGKDGVTLEQIAEYEHMRWNAYMRTEGYVYGQKKDDIAKTNPSLKSYWELSPEDRKKSEEIADKSLAQRNQDNVKAE